MDNFIVSARKYRPATFDMVVGQAAVTGTLKNAIKNRQIAHAYLFCGPKGVGKTTCARIFARTINCFNLQENGEACDRCESCISFNSSRSYNIHELDAASNNKVEDIRILIEQVRIPPQIGKFSIYIVDEVHMLSPSAFNAFLKTLEEPPAHVIFILATTEKHKIIPTILSRCQIFDFQRIRVEDIVERLKYVAGNENVTADENALHIIAQKADGSLRDALSIFDQMVSFYGKKITHEAVIENLNVLDYEYYFRTVDAALGSDVTRILLTFNEVLIKGFDGHNFIAGLNNHLRNLLVSKDESTIRLLDTAPSIREKYLAQSQRCSREFLYSALETGNTCDLGYKNSKNQRLHIELALINLCRLNEPLSQETEKKKHDLNPGKSSSPSEVREQYTRIMPGKSEKTESTIASEFAVPAGQKNEKRTVSLKEIINEVKSPEAEKNTPETAGTIKASLNENRVRSFNEADFLRVWTEFCETFKAEGPRVSGMLKSVKPEVHSDNSVTLHLNNPAHKDLFTDKLKHRLIALLEEKFREGTCKIELVVDTGESGGGLIYSDDQKFQFLSSKYPAIKEIRKTFNLDFE